MKKEATLAATLERVLNQPLNVDTQEAATVPQDQFLVVREYTGIAHKPGVIVYRGPDKAKAMEKAQTALDKHGASHVWVARIVAESRPTMVEV